ncbi:MAG: AAA family ATPase [bacterium]
MRLTHLIAYNIRALEQLRLALHPRCTVLAGVNGSGKTTILDSAAVVLGGFLLSDAPDGWRREIGDRDVRAVRTDVGNQAGLEPQWPATIHAVAMRETSQLTWSCGRRSLASKTVFESSSEDVRRYASPRTLQPFKSKLPLLAHYPSQRLWRSAPVTDQGVGDRLDGYTGWHDAAAQLTPLRDWIRGQEQTRIQQLALAFERGQSPDTVHLPALEAVQRTAARLIPDATRLRYDVGHQELRVEFKDGRELPLDFLSAGYRDLVALAGDIAWRAARLNPQLGADAPQQVEGVVLIDEIELHLHPAWQRTVLPDLMAAFPGLQFIVTTHSPQILASVPAEMVRFLDADGHVHLVNTAEGLDSNTVLRDLMGVPERPAAFTQRLAEVAGAIEAGQLQAARAQLDALAAQLGPDDPAITALEWELHDAQSAAAAP